MAKKAYMGVDNIARRIKKIYVGIDGTARRIKKAYVGVGGVARPCFSYSTIDRYGTADNLQVARRDLAGCSVGYSYTGMHALFGGGKNFDTPADARRYIDVYDDKLTHTIILLDESANMSNVAAPCYDTAIFADISNSNSATTRIYSIDSHLTLSYGSSSSFGAGRVRYAAAPLSDEWAVFGGGVTNYLTLSPSLSSKVSAFSYALTERSLPDLSVAREDFAATNVGDFVLFGGGNTSLDATDNSTISRVVDAYNTSYVKTTLSLSHKREYHAAASTTSHALFAGGDFEVSTTEITEAFDNNLTRLSIQAIKFDCRDLAAVSYKGCALFAGGRYYTTPLSVDMRIVNMYDSSLTLSILDDLSEGRNSLAAAVAGNYVLFGGGVISTKTSDTYCNTVDVYIKGD